MTAAVDELAAHVGVKRACVVLGRSRATHYRHRRPTPLGPPAPRPRLPRALQPDEQDSIIDTLNSERFCDLAPAQVWATLLDEGTYLASISSMYRLLRDRAQVRERRRQARRPPTVKPELVAALGGLSDVWRFDRMATVCHPATGRVTATFAAVAKHYAVSVAICPPRHGNRKGVVEKPTMSRRSDGGARSPMT